MGRETQSRAAYDEDTGPARFWSKRIVRQGLAIGFVVSAAFHYVISPFSLMPAGPAIEFHEQAGELSIPIDFIGEGNDDKTKASERASQTGNTASEGASDAGGHSDSGDAGANAQDLEAGARDAAAEEEDGGNPGLVAVADGGMGRDPQSLLGAAGAVSSAPNNITVMVNFTELRRHPEASRLGMVLGGIPQWRTFMSDSQGTALIDPMKDADWMLIMGPSLLDTQNDAIFIHYSTPDATVDKVIDTVSRHYSKGGPMDVGVRGVKAWKGFADKGERVFLRPRPHVAVIVPSAVATQFARTLAANPLTPRMRAGEALSVRALRPGGSIGAIPQDISELRMWIIPRASDGGGDLYLEGDCPSDAAATADAESIKTLIQQKNSFGVRLITAGFFNHVDTTTAGNQVHMHISGTQEQIESLLALAAGLVHVTLPPLSQSRAVPVAPTASASE